jgi:hypothetical protein
MRGLRQLRFTQPWTSDVRLHALEVKDVRSRQLEGISFEVADLERGRLTFTSATFTASVEAG